MPRVLRITPEMAGVPAVAPLARRSADDSGFGVAAQAINQFSRTVAATGHELLRIQAVLQHEDEKLDMQTRFNQLKLDFGLREAELRDTIAMPQPGGATATAVETPVGLGLPGAEAAEAPVTMLPAVVQPPQQPARLLQPKDYAQTFGSEIDRMVEESARGLKYPGTERAYRAAIGAWVGAQKIEALNRGIKLQHEAIVASDQLAAREEVNTAVFGAPTERAAAVESRLNRIQSFVARGIYSGAQAAAHTELFMGQIERGEIARDLRDPERRITVMDRLQTGGYKHIAPADQLEIARVWQDRYDEQARKAETEARRQFGEAQELIVSDLFARAGNGQLTKDELEQWRQKWSLKRTDYDAILTEMSKEPKEKASDAATLERIEPDTHSQYPRTSEAELRDLRAQGLLNRKDYIANLNRLRETKEGLLNRGESRSMRDHAQAEQELKAMLSIPPLADKLDQTQDRAWRMFLPELRQRSNAYQGKENPLDVLKQMQPRIEQFMGRDAALSDKQIQDALGLHQSWQALEAAKKGGTVSDAEYDTKRRLLIDQDIRRQRQEMQKASEQLMEQAFKAGVPRPKGQKAPSGGGAATGGGRRFSTD